jgi:dTDP-4-amino-4,6-dideoxygalactose transaminase
VTVVSPPERASTAVEPSWTVPLSDVLVDSELEDAVTAAVRSGWWSMGPRVEEFEDAFARSTGSRTALAVANGTAALHLALLALDCGPGDEVLVPSLNFVAAANAIAHTGATPVFCDVTSSLDLNIDPADLDAAVTPATRAVVVTHYGGYPARMDAIVDAAARHGLALIEDAAHAAGATWQKRACGTVGDVGCFSFFANKNLPTGEGGMVVTDRDDLAERIRLLRSHGMTTLTWDRHRGHAHDYDVVACGFNYRLDELRAAIGLVELQRLKEGNAARARIVDRYREALDGVAGIRMAFPRRAQGSSHHLAVVLLPHDGERDAFRAQLAASGVQTSVHYPPIHRFSQYCERGRRRLLPVTEGVADRLVTLPLYPHMSDADVSTVTAAALKATALL